MRDAIAVYPGTFDPFTRGHWDLVRRAAMLFENVIAQMLVANGHNLFFYTHYNGEKHRNDIEIDFIISGGNRSDTTSTSCNRWHSFSARAACCCIS